jgi:excisionase family DNA binding protein
LDGDGARASPAVWGALGQRPTEGPRSITTIVPCPPPQPGAGTNPSRGAGRVAAGRPGRLQEGWPDARGHRGRHQRKRWRADASAEGGWGCRKTPPVCVCMILTIKELAEQLRIKPGTLYAWAAHGKIPCRKIHGLVRFDRHEIDRWLSSFSPSKSVPPQIGNRRADHSNLDRVIASAKRGVYTPGHGETITPSPTGKE